MRGLTQQFRNRIARIILAARITWPFTLVIRHSVRAWMAVALLFGVIFALGIPMSLGQDEPNHIRRLHQISSGHVLPKNFAKETFGGKSDPCMEAYLAQRADEVARAPAVPLDTLFEKPIKGCEKRPAPVQEFNNTSAYSPVAYLPYVPAHFLLTKLNVRPGLVILGDRLLGLLIYVLLVGAALKMAPRIRTPLAVIGLLPMALIEASTINADMLSIALAILAAGLLTKLRSVPIPLPRHAAALVACVTLLPLIKATHLVLVPLVLFIPPHHLLLAPRNGVSGRLRTMWQRLGIKTRQRLTWVLPLVGLLIWSAIAPLPPAYPPALAKKYGIDPGEQLSHILHHPFVLLQTAFNELHRDWWRGDLRLPSIFGWVGHGRGELAVPSVRHAVPIWAVPIGLASLIWAHVAMVGDRKMADMRDRRVAKVMLGLFFFGWLLIYAALYVRVGPVGGNIAQFQGRYLIPLLPLLPLSLAMYMRPPFIHRPLLHPLIGIGVVTSLTISAVWMVNVFYTAV